MELDLINYKGLFNLGILAEETKAAWCEPDSKGQALLTLHLKAANGLHSFKKDSTLIINCKKTPIDQLNEMIVSRELHPIYEMDQANYEEILRANLFDSEFYERDGVAVLKKK
ncbi:hypothetical protein U1E44_07685 [Arenibacter sp. GZD96]|nr:hypothetical protein [Arenibacter sp. GZD-96]